MKYQRTVFLVVAAAVLFLCGQSPRKVVKPGIVMTEMAEKLLAALSEEQRALVTMEFDNPKRVDWHFIPKDTRKGLELNVIKGEPQKLKLVGALLRAALSEDGYRKATTIMQLESILAELEGENAKNKRDPFKYYLTIFGKPARDGKWGVSFEGHHLSLNYVVDGGEIVASTPTFFGANPAIVKDDYKSGVDRGIQKDHRVLSKEEEVAFEFLDSLSDNLFNDAVISEKAPNDIRAAGTEQPPLDKAEGLVADRLNDKQRDLLRELIRVHADNLPRSIARQRRDEVESRGFFKVRFAWAGAAEPGEGHYYRIQGPTFLIEFVNTQPDSAGNKANHIHSVWRDLKGDFGIPIKRDPKKAEAAAAAKP